MDVMTFTEAQLTSLVASVFWPFIRIAAFFTAVPLFSNNQCDQEGQHNLDPGG